MYNYIGTLKRGTAVRNSLTCRFINSKALNLLVVKSNTIELFNVSSNDISQQNFYTLNGNIKVIESINYLQYSSDPSIINNISSIGKEDSSTNKEQLFILTEDLEWSIISYNETTHGIDTLIKGCVNKEVGKLCQLNYSKFEDYIIINPYQNIFHVVFLKQNIREKYEDFSFRYDYLDLHFMIPLYICSNNDKLKDINQLIPQSTGLMGILKSAELNAEENKITSIKDNYYQSEKLVFEMSVFDSINEKLFYLRNKDQLNNKTRMIIDDEPTDDIDSKNNDTTLSSIKKERKNLIYKDTPWEYEKSDIDSTKNHNNNNINAPLNLNISNINPIQSTSKNIITNFLDLTETPDITLIFSPIIGGLVVFFTNSVIYYRIILEDETDYLEKKKLNIKKLRLVQTQKFNYINKRFISQTKIDSYRYLISDDKGKLFFFGFKSNKEFIFQYLGETSIPSSITYIDNNYVFIGSSHGNSQIIKLLIQQKNDRKNPQIEVIEELNSLAPVYDFIGIFNNDPRYICVSGLDKDCTLKTVRKGTSINAFLDLDMESVNDIFSVGLNNNKSLLILDMFTSTLCLEINNNQVTQINNSFIDSLFSNYSENKLLFASKVLDTIVLIKEKEIIIVNNDLSKIAFNFNFPIEEYAILAKIKENNICAFYTSKENVKIIDIESLINNITINKDNISKDKLVIFDIFLPETSISTFEVLNLQNQIDSDGFESNINIQSSVSYSNKKIDIIYYDLEESCIKYKDLTNAPHVLFSLNNLDINENDKYSIQLFSQEYFINSMSIIKFNTADYLFASVTKGILLIFQIINENINDIKSNIRLKLIHSLNINTSYFNIFNFLVDKKPRLFINSEQPLILNMVNETIPLITTINTKNCNKVVQLSNNSINSSISNNNIIAQQDYPVFCYKDRLVFGTLANHQTHNVLGKKINHQIFSIEELPKDNLIAYVGEKFVDDVMIGFLSICDSNLQVLKEYELETDYEQCTNFSIIRKDIFYTEYINKKNKKNSNAMEVDDEESTINLVSVDSNNDKKNKTLNNITNKNNQLLNLDRSGYFIIIGTALKDYNQLKEVEKGRIIVLDVSFINTDNTNNQQRKNISIKKITHLLVNGAVSSIIADEKNGLIFAGVSDSLQVAKIEVAENIHKNSEDLLDTELSKCPYIKNYFTN